jgi:predicted AAA+ superfamily ATPase
MIPRQTLDQVRSALSRQAAVALLGPRQVGKTTLALEVAAQQPSVYLDLEDPAQRQKLSDPTSYLGAHQHQLVVLDEIHRTPQLFAVLRGLIDQGRRQGYRTGRFLLLGSASIDLLRQSGESLAGRIAYLELTPLLASELSWEQQDRLWLRGGFPDSFRVDSERDSLAWRSDFVRTYLERELPLFTGRLPAETLRRLWTMLAHSQGGLLNASRLAQSLELATTTVQRYIDLLVDLMLVRRLPPYLSNVGKRLVRAPKVYIRDSGLLHVLLNLSSHEALLGHPVVGASWEGLVIENLLAVAPQGSVAGFYRTQNGAEIDLVLELPGGEVWAIEIKRSLYAPLARGFHQACADLKPARRWVVHAANERFGLGEGLEGIGLRWLMDELSRY